MPVLASAPGKVVILGEYAVLEGAPAIVMAVDRRATVKMQENGLSYHRITSPNWYDKPNEFTLSATGDVNWRSNRTSAKRAYKLFSHVIKTMISDGRLAANDLPGLDIELNTTPFYQSKQHKLGIGSSAALMVSLSAAMSHYASKEIEMTPLLDMHHAFQGGKGSGLDVATSFHGGVISFQKGLSKQHKWPNLPFSVIYTGNSASTKNYIQKFKEKMEENCTIVSEMREMAESSVQALSHEEPDTLLENIAEYGKLLQQLGKQCKMDILTQEHEAILNLATKAGIVYKTCGAGGGDIGMAFAKDEDKLASFNRALKSAGLQPLMMTMTTQGLELA